MSLCVIISDSEEFGECSSAQCKVHVPPVTVSNWN